MDSLFYFVHAGFALSIKLFISKPVNFLAPMLFHPSLPLGDSEWAAVWGLELTHNTKILET